MNQKSYFQSFVGVLMVLVFLLVGASFAGAESNLNPVNQLGQELSKMEAGGTEKAFSFQCSDTSLRVQNLDYLLSEASKYIQLVNGNKLIFDIEGAKNADPAVMYLVLALQESDEELRQIKTVKGANLFQFKTTMKLVTLLDPYFRSMENSQSEYLIGNVSVKESCNPAGADFSSNNCPPKKDWKSFSSKSKAEKFLKDEGYHETPWYAGPGYTKCVDAYGCSQDTCWFRNHGEIEKRSSKLYMVKRQKHEPNPEIQSYSWPKGLFYSYIWGTYVFYWHMFVC